MSCHIDDVFHFAGEPQRCLYCLDPLVLSVLADQYGEVFRYGEVEQCAGCGLQYQLSLLDEAGTERILSHPERFHITRIDVATMADRGPVPAVTITDLDHARSVLAARGDE